MCRRIEKNLKVRMKNAKLKVGFTFIEMMLTIVIMAICFVPLMRMFSTSISEVIYAGDKLTALNLAREQMERVKNLNLTEAQLLKLGDKIIPSSDKPPLKKNNTSWRIRRIFKKDTDPLEVKVEVYRESKVSQKILELSTMIEDLEWTKED